ncbi:SMI1 / KNR4 family [Sebaldella termitidis]|uniref:Knr4/Smi1-like domain-containing protein n=1 Tax=Sebaldella termitidis (strain ATCC 33386 / NCTC 11300) TaxID=526218 RepID=D1AMU4_SEBTE|nr:SMI1/KNR4 family protein [Sebaldella termitidis]ACZ07320.1 hypothetical protein Sterm_0440 [Sebaldella termitidis ATCC 33386]SUI22612.1 SMI1 / KNR4 family [Sebaldella termitidis]
MIEVDKKSIVYPLPSNERIADFEKAYRIEFPSEYKDFLKKYNGATLLTNILKIRDFEYIVERFLCLLDEPNENKIDGWYDLSVVLTQLDDRLIEDEDMVGMNIIPIASMFAGNFICLDYRNNSDPEIVIWFHEESGEFSPVTDKIADSINDFFNMLSKD